MTTVYSEILGNINSSEGWKEKLDALNDVEHIVLDQWTAQKSRFLGKGDLGGEYAVALARNQRVKDGDVIVYQPQEGKAAVIKLELNEVMVLDLSALAKEDPEAIIRHAVELGHAIGNQHWPAVVKGTKVYVPLTVDRKVMYSVMETHHIEDVEFHFEPGNDVIPYLAPHELRRLFGGASHESHSHEHCHEPYSHEYCHQHGIEHSHPECDGTTHHHHIH